MESQGRLWAMGWTTGIHFLAGAMIVFFLSSRYLDQPSSGALTASCPMGTRDKASGSWSQPPPSSGEVKNTWSYTSTRPIRLHGVVVGSTQGQLYLYLDWYLNIQTGFVRIYVTCGSVTGKGRLSCKQGISLLTAL